MFGLFKSKADAGSLPRQAYFRRFRSHKLAAGPLAVNLRAATAGLAAPAIFDIAEKRDEPGIIVIFVADDSGQTVQAHEVALDAAIAQLEISDNEQALLALELSQKNSLLPAVRSAGRPQMVLPQMRPSPAARDGFLDILKKGMGMVAQHPASLRLGMYCEPNIGSLVVVYEVWSDFDTIYQIRYGNPEMAAQADKTMAMAQGPHRVDWVNPA